MGNPITDLLHWASTGWNDITRGFDEVFHSAIDAPTLDDFERNTIAVLYRVGQAIQASAVLAATSNADTVQIGRDTAVNTRTALWFLRFVAIPEAGLAAERHADLVAAERAREVWLLAWSHILAEAGERALGDLRERLALDVAIAREHADMVTRDAIETDARVIAMAREAQARIAGDLEIRRDLLALISKDMQQLTAFIDQVRAYAQSIPGLEDLRAVSGYNPTLRARAGTLQRLIDTLAAHDPFIAGVIRDLATFLIDLAEVDDPLIRLAAQFVIRQVIDHLGLDTALRALTSDLLGGILGTGPPKTLTEVTAAIGNRLNAVESSVAALSPLADEADALHEMGTLAFDSALLAYLAAGVTDPRAWADDTNAVLNVTAGQVLGPLLRLLGAP